MAEGLDDQHKLIVLRDREMEFGLLADRLLGVDWIALADIQRPPPTVAGAHAEFLRGFTLTAGSCWTAASC